MHVARTFRRPAASLRAGLAALLLVAVAAPAMAQEIAPSPRRAMLTVTGKGLVTAAPDMASLSTGVVSEAKTAREALDANTAAVAEMIAAVKAAGVEARDITTSGFSVQPQYASVKRDGVDTQRIVGYEVRNGVAVRLRDLTALGPLLDAVVSKGANQVGAVEFGLAEPGKLQDAAQVAAVKDARRQADLLAEAAGQRVVRLVRMSDAAAPAPMPRMMAAQSFMKSDSVPVEAGESEVRAAITAVFEVEPR